MKYRLQVEIQPLEEGGYLAVCPQIEGCHAEGATIGEAIDNLQSVTQVIYDLCREKGLVFISGAPDASVERITWHIEVSPSLQVAA
jgi:predicted RNase H-like HicB family nuclease